MLSRDSVVSAVLTLRASAKAVTPLFSMLVVLMDRSVSAVLILRASAKAVTPLSQLVLMYSSVSAVLFLRDSAKVVAHPYQCCSGVVSEKSSLYQGKLHLENFIPVAIPKRGRRRKGRIPYHESFCELDKHSHEDNALKHGCCRW